MQCGTYNEHPIYEIADVTSLLVELEQFVPIYYDELSIGFLTESTICKLHKRFLGNPDPTDVITFPSSEQDKERTGEICISVDEALKYRNIQRLEDELTLYLIHGWLHLAHYDDINETKRIQMRAMEQKTLQFLSTQLVRQIQVYYR